jgi:antitoxin MazE
MPVVRKWGNSLAVRIPAAMASQLKVTAGTAVDIQLRNGTMVIKPKRRPKYSLREMLKQTRPEHLHPWIDFGPDVGREVLD